MSNLDRFFRSLNDDYRDTEKNEKAKESTLKRFDRVCDIAEKGDTYGRSDLSLGLDSPVDELIYPAEEEKSRMISWLENGEENFNLWLDEEIISGRIPKPPKGACKPISWISSKPKEKYIHPKMLKKENLPVGTHYFPSEKGMEVSYCSDLGFHIGYDNKDVVYRITIEVMTQVVDVWMDITKAVTVALNRESGFMSNVKCLETIPYNANSCDIALENLNVNFLRFKVKCITGKGDNDNSLTIVNTYSTEKSFHPKMLKKENLPAGTHYFPSEKGMEVSYCSNLGFHIEYSNRDVVYRITIEVVTQVADEWIDITRSVLIDGFSNGIYMQSEESKSGGWHVSIEDLNANFLRFKVERIISDFDDNDNSLTIVNTYSTEKSYANTMETATPYLDNFLKKYDTGLEGASAATILSGMCTESERDRYAVRADLNKTLGHLDNVLKKYDKTPTPYLDEAFDEVKKLGSNGLVVYKPQQPGPSDGWDSQTESPMQNQTPIEYLKERGVQSNGDGSFSISKAGLGDMIKVAELERARYQINWSEYDPLNMFITDCARAINSTIGNPYTATVVRPQQQPCTSAALEATLRQFTDLQELRDCELVKQEVIDQLAPWNKELTND